MFEKNINMGVVWRKRTLCHSFLKKLKAVFLHKSFFEYCIRQFILMNEWITTHFLIGKWPDSQENQVWDPKASLQSKTSKNLLMGPVSWVVSRESPTLQSIKYLDI